MTTIKNIPARAAASPASPLVSVLIPIYNCERYLAECLDSIVAQDFGDFEILISDDGSTDHSLKLVKAYAAKDARIRWWQNPRHLGMASNHNACLRAARGELIKFVHADDKLLQPSVVTRMVKILEADPAVSLVASGAFIIDAQARVIRRENRFRHSGSWDGPAAAVRCLEQNGNLIGEPSRTLFRKAQAARGFDERYQQTLDLEMWFHLLAQGRFVYLAEPLVGYRIHPGQATATHRRHGCGEDEHLMLLTDYYRQPWLRQHATRRMWFKQIYYLEKNYGPRAAVLTAAMQAELSPAWHAIYWAEHKFLRPLKKIAEKLTPAK